jgi:hypothetical protein
MKSESLVGFETGWFQVFLDRVFSGIVAGEPRVEFEEGTKKTIEYFRESLASPG